MGLGVGLGLGIAEAEGDGSGSVAAAVLAAPSTAKVRTITTVLTVTKRKPTGCANLGDEACGGRVIRATSFTYHDTFTKTADGWKKSRSTIRSDL